MHMILEHTYLNGETPAGNPYSDVVIAGDQLYISGLVALDFESQEMRYGTITEETKLVLDNLAMILEQYGSDMEHVIRADVLLADFSERDEMNVEYVRHFPKGHLPSRLCYGNVGLHGECRVEIAVIAAKK